MEKHLPFCYTTVMDTQLKATLKGIGQQVLERRQKLGISQEKLAELADLHRNYIGFVERGERNLSVQTLLRLSSALKISIGDLLR